MHIRYNETVDLWQYLSAVGPPEVWSTLPIDASQITGGGGNIAYTDAANVFIENQKVSKSNPIIYLNDTSQAANLRQYRIINSSQGLYIQPTNDAGTALTSPIQLNRSGDLAVERDILGSRDIVATRNIGASGFISASGSVSAAGSVFAYAGMYEYSRSILQGIWTSFTPTLVSGTVTESANCKYAIIGRTVFVNIWATVSVPLIAYLQMQWPTAGGYADQTNVIPVIWSGAGTGNIGYAHTQYGYNSLFIYSSAISGSWAASTYTLRMSGHFSMYGA